MSTQLLNPRDLLGQPQSVPPPRVSDGSKHNVLPNGTPLCGATVMLIKASAGVHEALDVDAVIRRTGSNLLFLQEKLSRARKVAADAVTIDPRVMHGNPVFKGTRIPIYQIVEELADGTPFEQLAEGYPSLTPESIRRGLDFAASLLRVSDDEVSD